ncbi:hypothetical protein VPH35_096964 [Triticum aestivum]|uniref:Uncharacterized protein n=1 Tax=Triticum aestivum TaxID=4565 RepID=A0A3B6MPA7_WHEAT|nr:uncharacterized protein LOC123124596 [Triticum aestivum]
MELARMDPPGVELPKSCLLAIKPVVADSTNATYQTEHPDDSRAISIQVSLFVHPFQMGRFTTLFYSTISSHLNISAAASGAKGDLEWLGTHREQQGGVGAYDADDKELEHVKPCLI